MVLHPAFVHLPIAFALFGAPLGIGLFLLARRFPEIRRSWILLVFWHLLLSATTYATMFTGEMAEERSEERQEASIQHEKIEAHEEIAELFFLLGLAAIPLATWGVKARQDLPRLLLIGLQVALLGLCIYVGYLGGQIRHGI